MVFRDFSIGLIYIGIKLLFFVLHIDSVANNFPFRDLKKEFSAKLNKRLNY